MTVGHRGYLYETPELTDAHGYLLPTVLGLVQSLLKVGGQGRIFELGCGNGSVASRLAGLGYSVTGIDYSESAIAMAKTHFPQLALEVGSVYDDLVARHGQFQLVLSLEVVEHLFFPRRFAQVLFNLLEPGGHALVSTPFHGYWKNLALALSGRMDAHFTALWDGGHIKFWSVASMTRLLAEAGFEIQAVHRVGRIPPLAKSMVFRIRKPVVSA